LLSFILFNWVRIYHFFTQFHTRVGYDFDIVVLVGFTLTADPLLIVEVMNELLNQEIPKIAAKVKTLRSVSEGNVNSMVFQGEAAPGYEAGDVYKSRDLAAACAE
jgi:hypothetical protein